MAPGGKYRLYRNGLLLFVVIMGMFIVGGLLYDRLSDSQRPSVFQTISSDSSALPPSQAVPGPIPGMAELQAQNEALSGEVKRMHAKFAEIMARVDALNSKLNAPAPALVELMASSKAAADSFSPAAAAAAAAISTPTRAGTTRGQTDAAAALDAAAAAPSVAAASAAASASAASSATGASSSNAAAATTPSSWLRSRMQPIPAESTARHAHDYLPLRVGEQSAFAAYQAIASDDWAAMRAAVRTEFAHAYLGYERWAWRKDELRPITRTGGGDYNMGLTIIDALDGMLLMGLEPQYARAIEWVEKDLVLGVQEGISFFETSIRVLGGLLSAYALRPEDEILLKQAVTLGKSMQFAFDSPSGLPYATLHLRTRKKANPSWARNSCSFAEATLQPEWQFLARLSGDDSFAATATRVNQVIDKLAVPLYSQYISATTGELTDSTITFGARVDSAYEYFLKQYVLAGGASAGADAALPRKLYLDSMSAMEEQVVFDSVPGNLTFIAELQSGRPAGKMDHLVCFAPGMLALGVASDAVDSMETAKWHMDLAERLVYTCNEFYVRSPTGLSPEIEQFGVKTDTYRPGSSAAATAAATGTNGQRRTGGPSPSPLDERRESRIKYDYSNFSATAVRRLKFFTERQMNIGVPDVLDFRIDHRARHNLLRPEAVESIFLLYRLTGDPKYRAWGWKIFLAFVRYCRIPGGGYSSLSDVSKTDAPEPPVEMENPFTASTVPPEGVARPTDWKNYRNHMESFFLAETLKYLYLLFSPEDVLPLDQWVFNTEAHPFPIALPPDVEPKPAMPHLQGRKLRV